jgi:hypothetical protein
MKIRKQGPRKFIVLVKERKKRENNRKKRKIKMFLRGKIKVHEDKLYLFRFRQMLRGKTRM